LNRPVVLQPASPDTTLAEPHPNSNTQQTKNEISQCGSSTT